MPSSTTRHHNGSSSGANKKQPLSPEQVIRMFGTTTSSSSVPTNYHYSNGGGGASGSGGGGAGVSSSRDRGRRSPASSPPSTTHQVNRVCLISHLSLINAFHVHLSLHLFGYFGKHAIYINCIRRFSFSISPIGNASAIAASPTSMSCPRALLPCPESRRTVTVSGSA